MFLVTTCCLATTHLIDDNDKFDVWGIFGYVIPILSMYISSIWKVLSALMFTNTRSRELGYQTKLKETNV